MEVPKRTHEYKNFLKIQLRINKSEKKITFYLKMRKLVSKIKVLNQCKLKDHWVKNITQKTVNTTDIEDS